VLPKVRAADPEAFLVSDGFSCREQIRSGAPRRAMHLAEVARMAVDARQMPARAVARLDARRPAGIAALALAGVAAVMSPRGVVRRRRRWRGLWLGRLLGAAAAAALALTGLAASVPRETEATR